MRGSLLQLYRVSGTLIFIMTSTLLNIPPAMGHDLGTRNNLLRNPRKHLAIGI